MSLVGKMLYRIGTEPTQLNTIYIGAKTGTIHTDELNDPEFDEMNFYIKFSRSFRF